MTVTIVNNQPPVVIQPQVTSVTITPPAAVTVSATSNPVTIAPIAAGISAPARWLYPESYGAVGDGVELTDVSLTGNVLASASASFTSADVGKVVSVAGAGRAPSGTTNGIPFAASVAPLYSTIASVTNSTTVVLADSAVQDVAGAWCAYGTDDATAMRNCFLAASSSGRAIWISAKNYVLSRPLDFLKRTTVWCAGQLILFRDPTNAGGFLIVKAGDSDIMWIGGVINCGELTNMNGLAVGYDPVGGVFSRNITFRPTLVTRARINTAMHSVYPFACGGKGVTAQFHLEGFTFEGRIENCDLGLTVESARNDNQLTSNVRITATVKDCPYGAAVFAGSIPEGVTSLDQWGYSESIHAQSRINLIVDNCGTAATIGTTRAMFWSNWMTNLELDAYVRNGNGSSAAPTLWKGNVARSVIKIRAAVDCLVDAYDLSPWADASGAAFVSAGNDLSVDLDVKNTMTGGMFRGNLAEAKSTYSATYDVSPSPSTLDVNITPSTAIRLTYYNRRLGYYRTGSSFDTTTNINTDPWLFWQSSVTFANIARWRETATAPTGATLVDGDVAGADGTVQSGGWGFAGPGPYVYRGAQAVWGKVRTMPPPVDIPSSAVLATNQADIPITNSGASSLVTLTLPAPSANTRGARWQFLVTSGNGIKIQCPTGTTIVIPGVGATTSGGSATCTTVGGSLEITQATSSAWYATAGMPSGWSVT